MELISCIVLLFFMQVDYFFYAVLQKIPLKIRTEDTVTFHPFMHNLDVWQ